MNRIMIIGCCGAGKSTLARQLHEATNINLIHLDQHFWHPNWVETDEEAWVEKVKALSNQPSWIMDGNYGGTMDIRLNKADVIIFLDRSRWICLYRAIKRVLRYYGKTRPDMQQGCEERFNWEFLKYIYNYNRTRRPKIMKRLSRWQDEKEVVVLKSNAAVRKYLQSLYKCRLT
jgi:adenylate kinase family enzyme